MSQQVKVTLNGKEYVGNYEIKGKTIIVSYNFRTEATQLGDTPPEVLAKLMMSELINKEVKNH